MGNSKSKAREREAARKLELFVAVKENALSDLQELLASGRIANVDASYESKETPLFYVKNVAVTTFLLENGADVNARNTKNKTPLFAAAKSSNARVVKLLIEYGADVNACNNKNETPLFAAAKLTDATLTKLLLENGADVRARDACEKTALHFAISGDVVKLLLEHGADVNAADQLGRSPLFNVVGLRDPAAVEALVAGGADVTLLSKSGESVMFAISRFTQVSTLEMLVEHGAPVNITSSANNTPLHAAVQAVSVELVRFMIDRGVPIDAKALTCKTPLHSAVILGHAGVFIELVTRYAVTFATASDEESRQLASSPTAPVWQAVVQDLPLDGSPMTLEESPMTWLRRMMELCPLLHDATSVCEGLVEHLERILRQIQSGKTQNTTTSKFTFALVVIHIWTWMLEYKAMTTEQRIFMSFRCLDEINAFHEIIYRFETSFEPVHDYNCFVRNWESGMKHKWSIRLIAKPDARKEIKDYVNEHLESISATQELRPRDFWRRMLVIGLGVELLHQQKLIYECNLSAWEADMLPPECQKTKGPAPTNATDVYMLGVRILFALTGGDPWKNVSKDVARVFKSANRLPSKPKSVSIEQWQLIEAMCATDPAKRVDMTHVVEKLRQFAQEANEL